MTKAILRYFIVVILAVLTLSTSLYTFILYQNNLNTMKQDMLYSLKLVEYSLNYNDDVDEQLYNMNLYAYGDDSRITILDRNGNVLYDTLNQMLDNHKDREEFKEAIVNGEGYAQRYSNTTKKDTLYVAYSSDNHILRLSIPYNGVIDYLQSMIPAISISIVLSFIAAYMLSRKLAYHVSLPIIDIGKGIDNMTEDFRFELKEYEFDEFNTIVDTIHNLSHRLRKSMREVQIERLKIDQIIRSMNEGFILLDAKNRVISINFKARDILGNIKVHDYILDCIDMDDLSEVIENNVSEQYVEIKVNHDIYGCFISRMSLGTTLFFVDITASKRAEKMRREFFSNVSHELKTPMTSIKGYSELLSQGIIANEQQKKVMLEKIGNEVNNMSRLINDILMLSRLENMDIQYDMLPLNIKHVVLEVLDSYSTLANKNKVHIHTNINDIEYIGNPEQMYTLLSNLIANAIKYNKENGDVWIVVKEENEAIRIIVRDNGIGIPKEDQSRIFERFYRVDKGRSRQLGGTGLGLAIVKHMVNSYKGMIHLNSELDVGTTIEIVLPNQKQTIKGESYET